MLHKLEVVKIVFYFLRQFNPIQYTIAIADDVAILSAQPSPNRLFDGLKKKGNKNIINKWHALYNSQAIDAPPRNGHIPCFQMIFIACHTQLNAPEKEKYK